MTATVDHLQSRMPPAGAPSQPSLGFPVAQVDEVLAQVGIDNVRSGGRTARWMAA